MILFLSISFALFFSSHKALANEENANHIVYLMHSGNSVSAFKAYQEHYTKHGCHDVELIERLGLILLDQGFHARDPETQLLTLYGSGISLNEKALYIIEDALINGQPELQLIALNFMNRLHHDRTDQLLYRAMASDQLLVRLEAGLQLASKKDPKAVGHLESLMLKLPHALWPLFPQLFALIDNQEAKKVLRRMLMHAEESVRMAVIASIAENMHDDFLPTLRRMASHHESGQQEACASALGILKDEHSIPRLLLLAKSSNKNVRLAALKALYQLGKEEVRAEVEQLAKTQYLFAIHVLGEMQGSEPVLTELLKSNDLHVRINAAMSLLELGHAHCTSVVAALLLKDKKDIALSKIASAGKSLYAWRATPSAAQNLENNPVLHELSLNLRESILAKTVELPEKEFLTIANLLLERQQNDLIPALIQVLENHPTPTTIALLKKYQQKAGAPLVRNYCNLALYRLKQPGPYAENLCNWVLEQRSVDMISFRPLIAWSVRDSINTSFELTPQETSRLLVEAFEALVAAQDEQGIDTLLSLIQSGNSKNKFALIGLLMRVIQ